MANTVSSLPTTNTTVFRPCDVVTASTTSGAVRVDNTISLCGVESWALHCSSSFDTFSFDSVVSALFHPVRS